MATAQLTKKGSFETMQRLGDLDEMRLKFEHLEVLEKAGKEPTTGHEAFKGRSGYSTDFLDGWVIPLPLAIGDSKNDMIELRRGGKGVELKYQNFSVIMSASRRMPMITACNINGGESKKVKRVDVWSYDGRLNKEDQWGDFIYDSNILDRGHMVRREDPVWGNHAKQANLDTFHFTNCCPQIAGINQKTWLGLENYILQHAREDEMFVSVFTGPFFKEDDLQYRDAKIPSSFWKVVAIVTEDGRPSATAYKISQEKELIDLEYIYSSYKTFQISIDSVIKDTQLDFNGLADYDGFSTFERSRMEKLEYKLESMEDIRI